MVWTAVCVLVLLATVQAGLEPSSAMENHLKQSYLFAYSVFQNVSAESESNVALSPAALLASLTMLYEGASEETEAILADVIQFPRDKQVLRAAQASVHAAVKSSVGPNNFYKKGTRFFVARDLHISDAYKKLLHSFYPNTGVEQVNFAATKATAGRINWWVREKTNGTIARIVKSDQLTSDTELAIISVEYFKGFWKTPFNPNNTLEMPFQVSSNEIIYTPLMYAKGKYHVVRVADQGYSLLKLPYQKSRLSLVMVLPDEDRTLSEVMDTFRDSFLLSPQLFVDALQDCEIFVPKFTVENTVDLSPVFKKMGRLGELFSGPANFSLMVENMTLSINSVTQKTRVQVEEEGTTAAAVQATVIDRRMMTNDCYFRASRPFLFLIQQDDVPVPLFMGRIVRPQV